MSRSQSHLLCLEGRGENLTRKLKKPNESLHSIFDRNVGEGSVLCFHRTRSRALFVGFPRRLSLFPKRKSHSRVWLITHRMKYDFGAGKVSFEVFSCGEIIFHLQHGITWNLSGFALVTLARVYRFIQRERNSQRGRALQLVLINGHFN